MRFLKFLSGLTVVAVLLALALGVQGLASPTDQQQQAPLAGTILQITALETHTVLLVLDTDGDGVGDLEVKVEATDTVLDANGQPVAFDQLTTDLQVAIPAYSFDQENGVYEADQVQQDGASTDNGSQDDQTNTANDGDQNDQTGDSNDDSGSDNGTGSADSSQGDGQDGSGDGGDDDDDDDD